MIRKEYGSKSSPKLPEPVEITLTAWRDDEVEKFDLVVEYQPNLKALAGRGSTDEKGLKTMSKLRSCMSHSDVVRSDSVLVANKKLSSREVWDAIIDDDDLFIDTDVFVQLFEDLVALAGERPTIG